VSFRQINKKTGHRLKQQLVDSVTGEVVEPQDKGRGYQVGKDEYLPVEDEELDSLALESTKIIDLEKFVTRSEIDVPARAPSAEDNQPKEAPASPDTNYNDASHTVLLYQDVVGVLGKEVRSSAGENLGRIVDLLVDQTGQVRAAMIDFGGFLGVGNRRIVVDWTALHFAPADQGDRITVDLTREQIRAAPEYKAGKPVIVLTAVPEM